MPCGVLCLSRSLIRSAETHRRREWCFCHLQDTEGEACSCETGLMWVQSLRMAGGADCCRCTVSCFIRKCWIHDEWSYNGWNSPCELGSISVCGATQPLNLVLHYFSVATLGSHLFRPPPHIHIQQWWKPQCIQSTVLECNFFCILALYLSISILHCFIRQLYYILFSFYIIKHITCPYDSVLYQHTERSHFVK